MWHFETVYVTPVDLAVEAQCSICLQSVRNSLEPSGWQRGLQIGLNSMKWIALTGAGCNRWTCYDHKDFTQLILMLMSMMSPLFWNNIKWSRSSKGFYRIQKKLFNQWRAVRGQKVLKNWWTHYLKKNGQRPLQNRSKIRIVQIFRTFCPLTLTLSTRVNLITKRVEYKCSCSPKCCNAKY